MSGAQSSQTFVSAGIIDGIMSETNDRTLDAYNNHLQEFIEGTTPDVTKFKDTKKWLDAFLGLLQIDADILEIGSGFGRDADYIEGRGFNVDRTDGAESFVRYMKAAGKSARNLNIITDEIDNLYDAIIANAVLLHLNPDELDGALEKIHSSLKERGVFAFTTKRGEGGEWSDEKLSSPRFYQYWEMDTILPVLGRNGFNIDQTFNNDNWLNIIAIKQS